MKKKQTLVLSIGTSLFLLLGIVGLKFHNEIYVWTLGDVKSLHAQAESLYQQKEYEEARKLYAKLAGIDSASRCQYVLAICISKVMVEKKITTRQEGFSFKQPRVEMPMHRITWVTFTPWASVRTRTSTKPRNGYAWGRLKVIRKQWSAWEAFTETVGGY